MPFFHSCIVISILSPFQHDSSPTSGDIIALIFALLSRILSRTIILYEMPTRVMQYVIPGLFWRTDCWSATDYRRNIHDSAAVYISVAHTCARPTRCIFHVNLYTAASVLAVAATVWFALIKQLIQCLRSEREREREREREKDRESLLTFSSHLNISDIYM